MVTTLLVIGLAKVVFGVLVGAAGIFLGSRVLTRGMRLRDAEKQSAGGNVAVGIVVASGLVALGILVSRAVVGAFTALDFVIQAGRVSAGSAVTIALYAMLHVVVALVVGAVSLACGSFLFAKLTRDVDEVAEIRKGNVAPALVLGAVLVVMALMTAPGLTTVLDGLLPLPELPSGQLRPPS